MKKTIFIILSVLFFMGGVCFADGLGALIEISKDQEGIQKILAEETGNFENVKNGMENGSIQKGQSKETIEQQYGSPVVIIRDEKAGGERWVYKPSGSSFFEGTKIYLFFDPQGQLTDTKAVTQKGGK